MGKYSKGKKTKLSSNFNSTEFDCHGKNCCKETIVDQKLVNYLQKIREHFGKPIYISSGYRCDIHNKNVGGATGSRHAKGQAADIYIDGVKPAEIAKYAESIGILGIGLYETEKDGFFVHIDTRTSKSFWYGQKQAYRSTFGGAVTEPQKQEVSKVDTSAADPKKVWDFLLKSGLNEYGAAGLIGNLYAESALRPTNLQQTFERKLNMTDAEYTAAVDAETYTNFVKDGAGYGLAQWTYWSRKQDMLNFHKTAGKSIGDLDTQLAFLVKEISSDYSSVWKVLKNATSVVEASNAVLLKYERPADQSLSVQTTRAKYGQKYYDDFATKASKNETQTPEQTEASSQTETVMTSGSKGEKVKKLQTDLKRLGFDCKKIDGIYGLNTKLAVIGLQIERELAPDGVCGPLTQKEIDAFAPYKAIVTANLLNVRSSPGLSNHIKKVIPKNSTHTIVYEKNGWGKLIDGAGWVSLEYVRKI